MVFRVLGIYNFDYIVISMKCLASQEGHLEEELTFINDACLAVVSSQQWRNLMRLDARKGHLRNQVCAHTSTGKYLSEAHNILRTCCVQILFWMSKQKQKTWNCNLRTCCVQKLFFVFVLTFRTISVHNMFSTCCELLTKIYLYLG